VLDRTHPDDRTHLKQSVDRASADRSGFSAEHRLVMPNGSIKYLQVVAHRAAADSPEGALLIGAGTDITERKQVEEQRAYVRELERELARINRVGMMGELAASLAHEIRQPIASVALSAEAGLRWMQRDPQGLEKVREALSAIIDDAKLATTIVDRNDSLY